MIKSVEATINPDGSIQLLKPVRLTRPCRAIVTIMDEQDIPETALLSEQSLSCDWERPEEDEAWSHLQQAQ